MKLFKSKPEFVNSINDSVCVAFGLELNSGEFEVKQESWGTIVIMNTATNQKTYDADLHDGCYVFIEA